jgi:hypothetical protein
MRGFGCYHHAAVTVGTTATLLSAGAPRALKRGLVLKNNSSSVVYMAINGTACTISATGTGIWANCAPPQLGIGQYVYISRQQSQ